MSDTTTAESEARTALLKDVLAAIAAQDYPRATQLAGAALNGGFEHPLFYNLRAFWLEGQGNDRAALHDLERARELSPNDPGILNALGLNLAKVDRTGDAVAAFDAALAVKPDFVQALYNKGCAQESLGDLNAATQSFNQALELKADYAEPLARLAQFASRRHAWNEVDDLANRSLAIDPNQVLALLALAIGALERKDLTLAETLLDRALKNTASQPFERSLVKSYLGELRHEQERYSEAFQLYYEANRERRALFAPRFDVPGSRTTAGDFAAWLRDYFQAAPAEQWAASESNISSINGGVRQHVFLVGFPRSGTTLLEQVLAGNPDVVTSDEHEAMREAIREFMANAPGRERLAQLSGRALDPFRARYWNNFKQFGLETEGKVFIDKHPLSTQMLPLISKLFPKAKILFAIRDPRDVVLGCFRRPFRVNPAMFEFLALGGTARFYDSVMGIGQICRQKLGLDWHDLRHESLLDDFDGELRKVTDFIGLEWNDEMRDFAQRARTRSARTPSAVQLARGLNRGGVGQWRNYSKELAPVLPTLKPWVERFGYEPE